MPTPFIGKLSLLHQRVDFDAKTFTSSMDIVLPKSDKIGQQCTPKCSFYGVYPRFYVYSVNLRCSHLSSSKAVQSQTLGSMMRHKADQQFLAIEIILFLRITGLKT